MFAGLSGEPEIAREENRSGFFCFGSRLFRRSGLCGLLGLRGRNRRLLDGGGFLRLRLGVGSGNDSRIFRIRRVRGSGGSLFLNDDYKLRIGCGLRERIAFPAVFLLETGFDGFLFCGVARGERGGERKSRKCENQFLHIEPQTFLTMITPLCPPNPRLVLTATLTARSRAVFGVQSRSQSGSGVV